MTGDDTFPADDGWREQAADRWGPTVRVWDGIHRDRHVPHSDDRPGQPGGIPPALLGEATEEEFGPWRD